jgi:hypothetical protein
MKLPIKIGDRVLYLNSNIAGTVESIDDNMMNMMNILFDGNTFLTCCENDDTWFKLIFSKPTQTQKEEWASIWDDSSS